jgi:CarD family transcriptional regulator
MFKIGERVVHPHHGAGIVVDIEELKCFGSDKQYYSIELLNDSGTLVIAVENAEKERIRRPIPQIKLGQVWRVLRAAPKTLPSDHNERYELVKGKLCGGDVLQVAEAVRDMSWKDQHVRSLTIEGKRLYDKGMMLLAGEVAVVQNSDFGVAEARISRVLREDLASAL